MYVDIIVIHVCKKLFEFPSMPFIILVSDFVPRILAVCAIWPDVARVVRLKV